MRTVSPQWVKHIIDTAEKLGVDRSQLLASVGLSEPSDARIALDKTVELWRAAIALTSDDYFGLHLGQQIRPSVLNRINYLILSSDSLATALEKSQAYLRLVSEGGEFSSKQDSHNIVIEYHPRIDSLEFSFHQIEAAIASLVQMLRCITEQELAPTKVTFVHEPPLDDSNHRDYFSCPVSFGAKRNAVYFSSQLKHMRLPTADPELFALHDAMAQRLLKQLSKSSWQDRVKQLLAARLALAAKDASCITKNSIAGDLNVSPRTLQRRLEAEGDGFQEILDNLRKELAQQYLNDPQLTIEDIGHLLGFSDSRNFYRTFKRWFNKTPRQWKSDQ